MASDLVSSFEKLVKGQLKYESANLGFNLLISRLQRKYSSNQTSAELNNCVQEINAYFEKYASLMAKDAEALKKL